MASLEDGLETLGLVMADRDLRADLVLVGAGALLLRGELVRPTGDLDVVARFEGGHLEAAEPLPPALVTVIREVGAALDLQHRPRDAKDWLNAGPSALLRFGLPPGFESRLSARRFHNLTIRLASRLDLIALKFLAATDPTREPNKKQADIADLRRLSPTPDELQHAAGWCASFDGRPDFEKLEAEPLLRTLGGSPE